MNLKDKNYAENLLKRIFVVSRLYGLEFGIGPGSIKIRFIHLQPLEQKPFTLWVNMESKWAVFTVEPVNNQEIPTISEEEMYQYIIELRRKKVVNVSLGEREPHLLIHFEDEKTLYVNGHHDHYECWQAGDDDGEGWLVVAMPGDDIAFWEPED
ncbi:hypothetical protein [Sutcliffiella horikoshii]|uniref:hypothetical protein n=1 Tax=Sutcliffiella horikoshii TaxID=79883 RepID=UPI003CF474DD